MKIKNSKTKKLPLILKKYKKLEVVFFHNEIDLLCKNAYLNFPILVKNKTNFINYMLKNGIDLSPQFYRSVNQLSIFSDFSDFTKETNVSVKKLVTLPTYPGINQKYILKVIEVINRYKP